MNKKVVFITGAAKGIGAAIATEFAKNNYNLILHYYTSEEKANKLKTYLEKKYAVSVALIQANLANEDEILNMCKVIIKEYSRIDVLINNAALSLDSDILDKTKKEFMEVLEVNVVAPFLLIKYLNQLLENGTIINVSSTDADDTGSVLSMDYCASKAALNSLTKTSALRFPNIKIVGVAPNWVKTEAVMEMNQEYLNEELKRVGQKQLIEPEEVAYQVLKLVEDSSFKSGSIIRIEG